MNWKDDQIEKLILFYSHNSLFLVPDFWYQKSCNWYTRNWYQILVPVFWYQFLIPFSGQYVMGISRILHITWKDRVRHKTVMKRTWKDVLETTIRKRRPLFGHVQRMERLRKSESRTALIPDETKKPKLTTHNLVGSPLNRYLTYGMGRRGTDWEDWKKWTAR